MDVAETRFGWLLHQRRYAFTPEAELQRKIELRGTRPDFYVETPLGDLLVEVESFEEETFLRRVELGGFQSLNPEPLFRRLRTAVKHAKGQLKPYTPLGMPMLIVLDDWRRVGIPNNTYELCNALFGTIEGRLPLAPIDGDRSYGPRLHHGGGQVLNAQAGLYVSAVAWNIASVRYGDADPMTEERPMYLRIVHNPFASVPLPRAMFDCSDDEHYVPPIATGTARHLGR